MEPTVNAILRAHNISGRIVTAAALGVPLRKAWIVPDDSASEVRYAGELDATSIATIIAGGAIAVAAFVGKLFQWPSSDLAQASVCARAATGHLLSSGDPRAEAWLLDRVDDAERILTGKETARKRLAALLLLGDIIDHLTVENALCV